MARTRRSVEQIALEDGAQWLRGHGFVERAGGLEWTHPEGLRARFAEGSWEVSAMAARSVAYSMTRSAGDPDRAFRRLHGALSVGSAESLAVLEMLDPQEVGA